MRKQAIVFQGIFVNISTNKNICAHIKVTTNMRNGTKNSRIDINDSKFQEYFNVNSDNEMIAKKILTIDMRTELVQFYNKYSLDYEIIFKDDKIYFRFFTGNILEPNIVGNPMDKDYLFAYYETLKSIVDISYKINESFKEIDILD